MKLRYRCIQVNHGRDGSTVNLEAIDPSGFSPFKPRPEGE